MANTAIILAAGKGSRLKEETGGLPKQYLDIAGYPILSYSFRTFLESPEINDILLVIPEGDQDYVNKEILPQLKKDAGDKMSAKFRGFAAGGKERYHSVFSGLQAITWPCDYVFIHDGARPFPDEAMLQRLLAAVKRDRAVVAGMPSKDTVKIADEDGFVAQTPSRRLVWTIQTPQVFAKQLITDSYRKLLEEEERLKAAGVEITDDAMAVEQMTGTRVRLCEGSYRNFKVTTPEDLETAWPIAMELQEKWHAELLEITVS